MTISTNNSTLSVAGTAKGVSGFGFEFSGFTGSGNLRNADVVVSYHGGSHAFEIAYNGNGSTAGGFTEDTYAVVATAGLTFTPAVLPMLPSRPLSIQSFSRCHPPQFTRLK